MIYCDYDDFMTLYPETELEPDVYDSLALRASRLIDRETLGRAEGFAAQCKEELAGACARLALLLQRQDALSQKAQGGAITSASTDGYSESFATPHELDKAFRQEVTLILQEALGHDPHGLLFRWL